MIKLKLAALAAVLLGPSAALYALRGDRPEHTLPAALCAQSLLLALLGYFLPFTACALVVAGLSAAAWVVAVAKVGSLRRAAGFFSLPVLLFLLCAPLLYAACARRVYLSFDEYSHWGLIVKVISRFDELPRAGRGAPLMMYTYPPAGAMLPALFCRVFGYRDGVAYVGYGMLIAGLMVGLAPEDAKGARRLAFPMVYLCMMAIFPLGMIRLFSEPVIALLAAMLIVRRPRPGSRLDAASEALFAMMLAMMKNTGAIILALALLARCAARRDGKDAMRCLGLLLAGACAAASYAVYCRAQGIAATASPTHVGENLRALLGGTLGEAYRSVPARFIQFFFFHKLSQSGVYSCYGFGTCATVYAFLLALCALQVAASRERRASLRLWAGVWLMNALYTLMIVASYYFFFEPWEVERLSEADRYMMLPALWTGLIACALLLEDARARRGMAAACAAALALLPLSHMEMTDGAFISRDYVERTIWARDAIDREGLFLKSEMDEGDRLLCMGVSAYNHVLLHYVTADELDIGSLWTSWENAPWNGDAQAVREELSRGGYTHVFVGELSEPGADGAIDARYASLTADGEPLAAQSLYRVERDESGAAVLVYQATAPQEVQ